MKDIIKIINGNIFGKNSIFRRGNISISEDIIADIDYNSVPDRGSGQTQVINADGLYVIPGLVDIHLHGAAGYDFCDGTEEAFRAIVNYELSQGVTSIVPATMTLPQEELETIMKAAGRYAKNSTSVKGITMEGPFISTKKKGAQNASFIRTPDIKLFGGLQAASQGLIKQVTVAPEADGAIGFIKEVSKNCVLSVAHTAASYSKARAAFEAGASHVTHLYNAMPPFGHRDPSVVGAAFDSKDVFVELICDGVHIHPSVIRAAFKMFGAERICMISDSMRATGMEDGEYTLGGQRVVRNGARALLADGTIAGAVSTLYDNLKKAVLEMDITIEDAVTSCTITPARSLGLDKECGVIEVGRKADIVLSDEELNIRYVIKDGIIIRGHTNNKNQ